VSIPDAGPAPAGFRHEALLYQGRNEFGAVLLPLLREGVRSGAAILVAVDTDKAELVRDELGYDAASIQFVDMREVGRNPARIIPVWRSFVAEHHARSALGVGEPVWPGRSPAELEECELHEALLNVAFGAGPPWRLVCPYDVVGVPADGVEVAFETHPLVPGFPVAARGSALSGVPDRFRTPLPEPAAHPFETAFDAPEALRELRHLVSARALESGLRPARADDLALAVSEVAANSIRHGGGSGRLRIWRERGTLVCEVRDYGRIDDPLVGRAAPEPLVEGQRGLWLVNQLCDLVQLRSLDEGVVVRLHTELADARVA
jgi:anti-sigma regulatory factor (Ser/Thr protein kinase)